MTSALLSPAPLADLDTAALREAHAAFAQAYDELKAAGLALDITRGKPSADQLDLSNDLLHLPDGAYRDAAGTDLRNYGGPNGLPELRAIFADALRVPVAQLLALGNSSLTIMHDTIAQALIHGVPGGELPWGRQSISFLAPVPGYDRHFTILERFGIRMIPVPMNEDGPDVEAVASLLAADDSIKGMWCVPVYSNPTGAVYSEEVVRALVSMPAAPDFRLFWDNAYAVHHLSDDRPAPIDVLALAAEAGNPDRPLIFASTSKVTFPGAGVAFFGASEANVAWFQHNAAAQSIGPDKLNQLRHVQLLKDADGLSAHMEKHRTILEPKFAAVDTAFRERLAPWGAGTWNAPKGGYFVSLDVLDGSAKRAVQLAKEAGIAVTPAGATFPYGDDPRDANIRIAPTFPPVEELRTALDGLCTAILLAEAETLLAGRD
ncbi:aminotransferase class I/II-fold pyridoxal phosphate-dependent enzyme [Leifsonia virtsii]|uniref:Aminotransferase class I/II-fold pyridoxal phosphate-dependent enzyme n=1 Tax=Leifsonia virtsii TaxID=3035915 RepID=A0ABT8ISV3_9MICO|nr:aminotransferase class I/II-fold pyridoxal phosphate-dependent enzyme [Leifsonia virtsii]MDN4595870.1 aminotransferase class I/II-fold pyridoxal phosphate-dependent enzyme [Leifsonia virtsii]